MIFAVFDVLLAVNMCINYSFYICLWAGAAFGVYIRAQVGKLGYCLMSLLLDCQYGLFWSVSSSNILIFVFYQFVWSGGP